MQFELILSNSILNTKFTFYFFGRIRHAYGLLNIPMVCLWNSVAVVTSGARCSLGRAPASRVPRARASTLAPPAITYAGRIKG